MFYRLSILLTLTLSLTSLTVYALARTSPPPDNPYSLYTALTASDVRARAACAVERWYDADTVTYCFIQFPRGYVGFTLAANNTLRTVSFARLDTGMRFGDVVAIFGQPHVSYQGLYSFRAIWFVQGWKISMYARLDDMRSNARFVLFQAYGVDCVR